MRKVIGTIVGIVLAVAMVDGLWALANMWFPAPIPADADDLTVLRDFVTLMPIGGHIIIAAAWFLAGLIGAFAALRIAQWRPGGWIVALLLVASGIWDVTQLRHPLWLTIATLVLPLFGAWLAERHFHRARPGDPLIN